MYSETCNKCSKRVQSFSPFMKCSNCSATYHITCVHLVKDDPVNGDIWYCPPCIQCILPFNHVDDDDVFIEAVIEASLDCSYRIHEINTKIFVPFEINDDSPFHEIDPDMQFYSDNHYIQSTSCDYYLEDSFNEKFGNKGNLDHSLTFFHQNIKSLPKHQNELELYLDSLNCNFSFIGLTETWLDESKEALHDIVNYTCLHRYRHNRKGGGVTIAVRNGIAFKVRSDLEFFDSEMESVFIEVEKSIFGTSSNLVIGVIYRMPDSSVEIFNDRMNDWLNIIQREKKICYFLGDLNLDLLRNEEHRPTSAFLDILYSYNVYPLISKPTRVTANSATLIDHILTNNFDVQCKHKQGILCNSITDHYAVFHITNGSGTVAEQSEFILKRDYRYNNILKFKENLAKIQWDRILNEQNAQVAYNAFCNILTQEYDKCFPIKKHSKKYCNKKPWLTSALKESIKIKNKLYISRNRGNETERRISHYKTYRNKLHHLLRAAERQYYQDLLTEHKSNLKKSWQVIKMIINKRKCNLTCSKFKCNGSVIEDGKIIANKFNDFFINVGPTLAKNIPSTKKNPTEYITQNIETVFAVSPVSDHEILKILGDLKDSAAGWDELRPNMIKHVKQDIKLPLAHICNLSFGTGVFPSDLKIANVVPIFKANDEMIFSNYRPVSVLPVFSKLIERLMYNRLIQYINENKLLYEYQFGFQRGKSTHMALIVLLDKISEALDRGECVMGVFLDFSKAFDTVDHSILLRKMQKYGIQGLALRWFEDYLHDRKQYVTYNSYKSNQEAIKCGVPQGSILGPLLFLIYINDLSSVSEACFSILFADDTNMFITGHNVSEMCNQLNADLFRVQEWLHCNKLSLNVLKTHYMIFTPRNKIYDDVSIIINNTKISRVYVTKFLGVQIDSQLSWKMHIDYICKKLSKCTAILLKARKVLGKSCLTTLYYTFAYPYFIYCNHVWGNTYQTNLDRLMIIQKKLIRIITGSPYRAHTEPLFYANRILTVYDLNVNIVGVFMYKCLFEPGTDVFATYFYTNRDIHGRETRNADALYVPYGRLDIRRSSIKIHGSDLWNTLPPYVQNSDSSNVFKLRLRNYLIDRKMSM